jgi:hypothetical protein
VIKRAYYLFESFLGVSILLSQSLPVTLAIAEQSTKQTPSPAELATATAEYQKALAEYTKSQQTYTAAATSSADKEYVAR